MIKTILPKCSSRLDLNDVESPCKIRNKSSKILPGWFATGQYDKLAMWSTGLHGTTGDMLWIHIWIILIVPFGITEPAGQIAACEPDKDRGVSREWAFALQRVPNVLNLKESVWM